MRPRSPPISKAETTITSPRHTDHAFDSLPVSLRVLKRKTGHPEAGRSDRVSENHNLKLAFERYYLAQIRHDLPSLDFGW